MTTVIAIITYAAGVFTGISVPKIISWFKSEETKVQTAINEITTKNL